MRRLARGLPAVLRGAGIAWAALAARPARDGGAPACGPQATCREADVETPLPRGASIPYGEVLAACRALLAAGAAGIVSRSAPMPLPRDREAGGG